ncbi:peptidoglycan DD-metalloendopeptidase family protein [Nonomuraea rubra]|uniref:M23 family metallopeptidase n=1 Tax=Nonomuraea rubra TaxID=46180 RepID=UPI0036211E45
MPAALPSPTPRNPRPHRSPGPQPTCSKPSAIPRANSRAPPRPIPRRQRPSPHPASTARHPHRTRLPQPATLATPGFHSPPPSPHPASTARHPRHILLSQSASHTPEPQPTARSHPPPTAHPALLPFIHRTAFALSLPNPTRPSSHHERPALPRPPPIAGPATTPKSPEKSRRSHLNTAHLNNPDPLHHSRFPSESRSPTWRWPLDGTPRILRPFTPPPEPWLAGHRGIDLAAPADTPVLAAGPGTIRFAGPVAGKGVITIDHEGGLRTTYLPVTASVRRGQPITPGAKLGVLEPSKHHCEESCLHWGLRRGTSYLNPLQLLGHAPTRLLPFWPPPQRTPTTPQPRTAARVPTPATTPAIPPGSTPLTPLTTAIAATMTDIDPDNGSPTPTATTPPEAPTPALTPIQTPPQAPA